MAGISPESVIGRSKGLPFHLDAAIRLEDLDERDPADTIIPIDSVLTLIETAHVDDASK